MWKADWCSSFGSSASPFPAFLPLSQSLQVEEGSYCGLSGPPPSALIYLIPDFTGLGRLVLGQACRAGWETSSPGLFSGEAIQIQVPAVPLTQPSQLGSQTHRVPFFFYSVKSLLLASYFHVPLLTSSRGI